TFAAQTNVGATHLVSGQRYIDKRVGAASNWTPALSAPTMRLLAISTPSIALLSASRWTPIVFAVGVGNRIWKYPADEGAQTECALRSRQRQAWSTSHWRSCRHRYQSR